MLGRFLELSVWSRDVAASAAFWEGLGLAHGRVGDTWQHHYAVLSDGRLVLGLHAYEFDSPSITWVRPELAAALPGIAAAGIDFDFAKTGEHEFNEAGFRDPDGQVVTLLEARTWSADFGHEWTPSLLGHFVAYCYPARDPAATVAFWERLGLVPDETGTGPVAVAGGLTIAPAETAGGPELLFEHPDPAALRGTLEDRGHTLRPGAGGELLLRAPDELLIRVRPAGS
ncbi:hypothetical protein [Thioalkalivibrio sp. XN8]|uniref:hypothetical protein n=1 Tax=Thioalkalivibrio sp. XN8 TaxID=2712863 RepID=UPI0013EB4C31|nr:hypothetical protein [Thioalkalivibrio sp. XN8]NGP53454.1 hypothetical protein [Thioalkalivibrio sp. XN8]